MPKSRKLQGAAGVKSRVGRLPLVDEHADELRDSYVEAQKNVFQVLRTVWASDCLRGFYRGICPGVTGSLATGATYFGIIESTKAWLENANPILSGHWSHFIACTIVMKQRMQAQGTQKSWASAAAKGSISQAHGTRMYGYYNGMLHVGFSIWGDHGLRGLYIIIVMGLRCMGTTMECRILVYTRQRCPFCWYSGCSAYLTTPLDVIKTRLQVQGSISRYDSGLLMFLRDC